MPSQRPALFAPAPVDLTAVTARRPVTPEVGPQKLPSRSAELATIQLPERRERMQSKGLRLPESMLNQVEDICHERRIEFSAFVRSCIEAALYTLKNSESDS